MKRLIFITLGLAALLCVRASAQSKVSASAECIKYTSYYQDDLKAKDYASAAANWRKAYGLCPAIFSQNIYINGATLIKRLINENAKNPEYRAALVDTLMMIYDKRAEAYPKTVVTVLNNMGLDVASLVKNEPSFAFRQYEKVIGTNGTATRPRILLFDFQAGIDLYKRDSIDAARLVSIYQRNAGLVDGFVAKTAKDSAEVADVKRDLGSLFASSKVADCKSLIELYSPRINEFADDLALVTTIIKTMNLTEDCNDNDLYLRAVTVMSKKEPSAGVYYYLYRLHASRGEVDEAIANVDRAIASDETDAETDAEYAYEAATFCFKQGRSAKAYEYAGRVVEDERLGGKALFLMGTIWGGTRCGGNEIDTRAPMWAACDYMRRAKNADASLAEEADRYIAKYSSYFPTAADAFMYGLSAGDAYTVSCGGIYANTTVKVRR